MKGAIEGAVGARGRLAGLRRRGDDRKRERRQDRGERAAD